MSNETDQERGPSPDVAIVGMAGRFPGADDVETFWNNVRGGVESISFFTDDELRAAGVPDVLLEHPDYVKAIGKLRDVEHFDAGFFGYSPREAELLEPGHRLFLEIAWEAMEDAGYDSARVRGSVGVFAGAGNSGYTDRHVRANHALAASAGEFQLTVGSGKDFVATRTSYKMNLRGPSVAVQTGCSTALVAVHMACQSLLNGECDMALAGGTSVNVPQVTGYLFQHGSILSPDGHCRAFDAKARGAQAGSGAGAVVLKRLEDALADGDQVYAVIRGSAVNNDGSVKVAYTAPSVEGQSAVISEALAVADVDPGTVTYVEAHGTGTDLGDPIEIAALTRAFGAATDRKQFCAVGSVKTNIGHLDTAAGIAGLIKAALALRHRELPPTVHFETPNPKIDFASSPFYVSGELRPWETPPGVPRRAGVSSFGIGGTNAHVVLEEAPAAEPADEGEPYQLLVLSARSPGALDAATDRLADHLRAHPEQPLADVAWTLQAGRRAFVHRRAVVVRRGEDVPAVLEARTPDRVATGAVGDELRSVAFLFPGLGDQYPQMGRGLYESEPAFRAAVDECAQILTPLLGLDLREVMYPGEAPADPGADAGKGGFDLRRMLQQQPASDPAAERLNRTELAQPAVFVVSYALAKLWESLGIRPSAVIGHSLGEYTAACVAGVLSLPDALRLVAARARLIQGLPGGAMLAVSAAPDAVRPHLPEGVSIATVNAPQLCVAAGPDDAVAELESRLAEAGVVSRRLPATHAFHSAMMEPALAEFEALVAGVTMNAPAVPFVSNLTGTWLGAADVADPRYWVRHMRETVQFDRGIAELLKEPGRVLVEVGPGQTLSTFVRQRSADAGVSDVTVVPSVRYPYDRTADVAFLRAAAGRLWVAGVGPDWSALHRGEARRRVSLPTYPWERQRYWVEAPAPGEMAAPVQGRRPDPADWTYLPAWRRAAAAAPAPDAPQAWVVFADEDGVGERVAAALRAAGREVSVARVGGAFGRADDGSFLLRPWAREDYQALAAEVAGEGSMGVVHAWAAGEGGAAQARGFVSLARVADALGRDRPVTLLAVTRGVFDVTGAEALEPARAAVVAAARCLGQEHATVTCRAVDVVPGVDDEALARRLADEALSGSPEALVALRGRRRWVLRHDAVRAPAGGAARIREGGVFLLTHSVEGRNADFARRLAAAGGATLLLVDRGLPHPAEWDALLAQYPAGEPVRDRVQTIRELEAAGARVHVLSADPGQKGSLAAALAQAEAATGPVTGVLHAPAVGELYQFAAAAEARADEWERTVAAVLAELAELERALEGRAPDFVLLESSLTSALGGVGLSRIAAVNAVTEAYAAAQALRGDVPWTAVSWDRWGHDGDGMGEYYVSPAEAGRALEQVLALGGEPQVLVSSGDVAARMAHAGAARRRAEDGAGGYARPDDLGVEYHAPTNDVEERIVTMWQELLGIDRIGIHDDFFSLGGHSLLATQIISRVRDLFQLELPLAAIFEAPTPARFAVLIEEAIIAELEGITEEEALELL